MRFVFFGTPDFAAIILDELTNSGMMPLAVVCNPDRPVGRNKVVTSPPIKQLIDNNKWPIEVLQPENPLAIRDKLTVLKPDFFVVAAYGKILKSEIYAIPRLGTIGVHPSLLPKYRGTTPIQTAILNGETETGITLYLLDDKVDHGGVIAQGKINIETHDNYELLLNKLARNAGDLLKKTLEPFVLGTITPRLQDDAKATFTKKFVMEDAFILPDDLKKAIGGNMGIGTTIFRKIKALNPEPGTWTNDWDLYPGKRVKILDSEIKDGKLKIKKIQAEGKKPQIL